MYIYKHALLNRILSQWGLCLIIYEYIYILCAIHADPLLVTSRGIFSSSFPMESNMIVVTVFLLIIWTNRKKSVGLIIKRQIVTTIVFPSIWKELEKDFFFKCTLFFFFERTSLWSTILENSTSAVWEASAARRNEGAQLRASSMP